MRRKRWIKIKTEKEIREEIECCKKTIDNYKKAYKEKKIPKDVLKSTLLECENSILALKWVLGENDRYD
ncbi:hypothetical protein [Clostridium botulinum]|uniref:hypothetical protein n=1 Tax=Clostridium botulinum TaxID=1491 RepID=UPI001FA7AC05|nr:hypothetical protein [Clostridium botulinum]